MIRRKGMTSSLMVVSLLTMMATLISISAEAGPHQVGKCRATTGRPTYHACVRGGGDREACKERASFAVKECLASNLRRCKELALERALTLSRSDKPALARFIHDCRAGRVR